MAIGATEGDVQRQFLTEAVVMSLIGGAVGIAVGVVASFTIAATAGWPILVSGGGDCRRCRLSPWRLEFSLAIIRRRKPRALIRLKRCVTSKQELSIHAIEHNIS